MQSHQITWDAQIAKGAKFSDLDTLVVRDFIKRVNAKERFRLSGTPLQCLEKLKLVQKGKPTNAAILLFAKDPTMHNVHIGRFKTPSIIVDDKYISVSLFRAAEEAMRYFITSIKVAFNISDDSIQRSEIYEYPLAGLRELLLNSLVHRDYLSATDVQIKIFDKAITFFNPGNLYGGLTVQDLLSDNYPSQTRNKLIAEAFYLTGEIEKYGSGFIRVREAIRNYPTMKFNLSEVGGGFLAELKYEKQKTIEPVFKIPSEGLNGGLNEGLSEGLLSLLRAIQQNPGIQVHALSLILNNRPAKTIERQIANLKNLNLIIRKGSKKTGGYFANLNDPWFDVEV